MVSGRTLHESSVDVASTATQNFDQGISRFAFTLSGLLVCERVPVELESSGKLFVGGIAKVSQRVCPPGARIAALLVIVFGVLLHLGWSAWNAFGIRAAEKALSRRDFAEARQRLANQLRTYPTESRVIMLAAQAARRHGEVEEATRLLDDAQQANADLDEVELERALIRLQTGDMESASHFLDACEAHPDAAPTPLILETLIIGSLKRLELSLAERSLELWEAICESAPDRIQGWIWRGDLSIRLGDVETALQRYREVLDAVPENDSVRRRLAELTVSYAPRESLVHLDVLQATLPHDDGLFLLRAKCHRTLGEVERADELLAEILVNSGSNYDAMLERGLIAMDLRRFDAAEDWIRAAMEIHPDRRTPNLALARCLQLSGKVDEAQRYREAVDRIDAVLDEQMERLRKKGTVEE